jgi:hypothetical protein
VQLVVYYIYLDVHLAGCTSTEGRVAFCGRRWRARWRTC